MSDAATQDHAIVRSDLAVAVHAAIGGTRNRSVLVVDSILENLQRLMKEDGEVGIARFGTFVVRTRSARNGRNPKTGEIVPVPARESVVFRPAVALRDKVAAIATSSAGGKA